jgi:chromosome segregation ATPase
MLEDLDALSLRIQKVVQLAQGLQAERRALQARIQQLEQECQTLKALQASERDEFVRMSERAARHDQELQAVRDETAQTRSALETQVLDHQARTESLQQRLAATQADYEQLCSAATGAQRQIELILERLPGAEA